MEDGTTQKMEMEKARNEPRMGMKNLPFWSGQPAVPAAVNV